MGQLWERLWGRRPKFNGRTVAEGKGGGVKIGYLALGKEGPLLRIEDKPECMALLQLGAKVGETQCCTTQPLHRLWLVFPPR